MRFTTAIAFAAAAASATSSFAVPLEARRARGGSGLGNALEKANNAAGIANGLSGAAANVYSAAQTNQARDLAARRVTSTARPHIPQRPRDVDDFQTLVARRTKSGSLPILPKGHRSSLRARDVELELVSRQFDSGSHHTLSPPVPPKGPRGSHHSTRRRPRDVEHELVARRTKSGSLPVLPKGHRSSLRARDGDVDLEARQFESGSHHTLSAPVPPEGPRSSHHTTRPRPRDIEDVSDVESREYSDDLQARQFWLD
ncbi:hypothetical protein EIP91_009033 [Steccherinum ochraceum]|uniref:Uncharacterized protein n=1 Tax=Steccherinum ochraceum TaxID=92696 RepID=A0A4R0R4G3_9APHY|nr:hypothetical protein EIP91_009033 [Steccherinum ochraceum]